MADYEISVESKRRGPNEYLFLLTCAHGSLDLTFNQQSGWAGIANIDVDEEFRRQGIGTALVNEAVNIATERDAKLLHGALINEASVGLMTSIFGPEAVLPSGLVEGGNLWHELK